MSVHVPAPVVRTAQAPPAPVPAKAGPIGPGAGVLMTEYLLPSVLGTDPRQRMDRALKIGTEVDWIRSAERAIASKLTGCKWHLEDPDGETIDEEYGDPGAVEAYNLLLNPQAELPLSGSEGVGMRQTRRQQLGLTSRHMGLAGNGVIMLDSLDDFGCPHALLTIRPGRLEPVCTKAGTLKGWLLDKSPTNEGTPIDVEELLLFQFQPPDVGVWGVGLIESAMAKAINNGLIDRHFSALFASGGRISGVMAPKEGVIYDDNIYEQLKRDWRNITEQPEAARRLQIVRAPIDFTPTVQSVDDLKIIELMDKNRDALLALWGVPLSQIGGTSPSGLNSGERPKHEEAVLWQAAVHDRIVEITETFQAGILDKWEERLGWAPKLCFEEPSFDDEEPSFNKLQKAAGTPLRNAERRAIIGLDPFGEPSLDNAIWMPVNVVAMAMAPDEDGKIPKPPPELVEVISPIGTSVNTGSSAVQTQQGILSGAIQPGGRGGTSAAQLPARSSAGAAPPATKAAAVYVPAFKARDLGARRLRDNMEARILPRFQSAVEAALEEQMRLIRTAVMKHWDSIVRHKGRDETMWWTEATAAPLERSVRPAQVGVATAVSDHINEAFRG